PWLQRHHAEISFPVTRRKPDRIGADPGISRTLWAALRSPYNLRLDSGRLRLWLQVLRQRIGRLYTKPRRGRNGPTAHQDRKEKWKKDRQRLIVGKGRAARDPKTPSQRILSKHGARGVRHRRPPHHRLDQRTGTANPRAGQRIHSISSRSFTTWRDRRSAWP